MPFICVSGAASRGVCTQSPAGDRRKALPGDLEPESEVTRERANPQIDCCP